MALTDILVFRLKNLLSLRTGWVLVSRVFSSLLTLAIYVGRFRFSDQS